MPSMTTSSWLSAIWPPPPNIPPATAWFTIDPSRCAQPGYGDAGSGARCAKSRSRQARVSRIMSPVGFSAPCGPKNRKSSSDGGCIVWSARAPPADGVDLVDEDDALAAPFRGELLRLAREEAHDEHVDADERLREAGAGDRDEGRVEVRSRSPSPASSCRCPGAPRKSTPRSRLPPAASKCSPDCQSETIAADLLLRLLLPADVVELDAPLGVAGLEAADLADAHQHERAHEDQEVADEEEPEEEELHPERSRCRSRRRRR